MTQALSAQPIESPRASARAAARLWAASGAALALMPAVMAVAHRSSLLMIVVAALLAAGAAALDGSLPGILAGLRRALRSPLGAVVLAFLAWSALSVAWSPRPGLSLHALGEFVLALAAAAFLSRALPGRLPPRAILGLAALSALACLSIVFELRTGLELRRRLGMRAHDFVLNRPVLTVLALGAPAIWWLAGRRGPAGPLGAAALLALAATAALHSESQAAWLGLAAGLLVFAVARLAPRLALAAAALALAAAAAAAPVIGDAADRGLPASMHEAMAASNSRARVDIWLSFGAAVRETPLAGSGFGSSARLHEAPLAARVPPERRELLGAGHPHNAALQVWVELGLLGAGLALAVALLALRSLARLDARALAPRLALFGGAAAVALVGHGAWQGWWAAALGASIVWFRIVSFREPAR